MRRLMTPRAVRLVVGGLLVAGAALLLALDGDAEGSDFLVFTRDIGVGGVVDGGDLRAVRVQVPAEQAGTLVPAGETDAVVGSRLLRRHSTGELVPWASLAPVAEASGYTVSVPLTSFGGELRAGDVVDVIAAGEGREASVVATGVEVTGVRTVNGSEVGGEDLLLVGLDAPREILLTIEDAGGTGRLRLLRGKAGPP